MKPDLRLRLHATQAQPCFLAASNLAASNLAASNLAASNALALPGGNGIFTTTPTERITHYTLLRKVVCQMGALPPLETPTRKGGTLPPLSHLLTAGAETPRRCATCSCVSPSSFLFLRITSLTGISVAGYESSPAVRKSHTPSSGNTIRESLDCGYSTHTANGIQSGIRRGSV